HAIAGIDRYDDPVLPLARHVANELRVLQRGRADHHPRHPEIEPTFDGFGRADSAAELDVAGERFDDPLDRLAVAALPGEGAVEIDDVQVLRPGFGEGQRLRSRVVAVDGGAVHITFGQAHDLALLEIDSGKDNHPAAPSSGSLPIPC